MSIAVASMPSPHQFPVGESIGEPSSQLTKSSPNKGFRPPTTTAERTFAEGNKSSPSKHQREEARGAYRAQSIKALREVNGDVGAFLEELEVKRRQLDEQIQRYIKQKDREFKLFERDTRIKYRNAGIAGKQAARKAAAGPSRSGPHSKTDGDTSHDSKDQDAQLDTAEQQHDLQAHSQPRLADNGLLDRQASREREADLLGVFTPDYLPMLSTKSESTEKPPLSPASLPASTLTSAMASLPTPLDRALHRANSDPVDERVAKQSRIKLQTRTSSSGSETKSLVSVLKSPAAQVREPKRKRVSLVVGDDIVAPSDSLNTMTRANNEQADHAEHVERIVDFVNDRTSPQIPELDEEEETSPTASSETTTRDASVPPSQPTQIVPTILTHSPSISGTASASTSSERRASVASDLSSTASQTLRDESAAAALPKASSPISIASQKAPALQPAASSKAREDAEDDDVFDFSDTELGSSTRRGRPPSEDEATDGDDTDADVSPVGSPQLSERRATPSRGPSDQVVIGTPLRPRMSGTRTSSFGSFKTTGPGFSRPSVMQDPIGVGVLDADGNTMEIEQNHIYGSLKASLSSQASVLAESYMQRNSELFRKSGRRTSKSSDGEKTQS